MGAISYQVQIARPSDEIFAWLTDVDRLPLWEVGLYTIEAETEGPLQTGTVLSALRQGPLGWPLTSRTDVLLAEPPTRLEVVIESWAMRIAADIRLEQGTEATDVTVVAQVSGQGALRLAGGLLTTFVRQQVESSFDRLRELVEAEAGGTWPGAESGREPDL